MRKSEDVEVANWASLALDQLWTREAVLASPSPVPKDLGVYAWFFRDLPELVPTEGCFACEDLRLLYVGIAPKAPPKNGARPSKRRLYDRIRYHYRGSANGSTLRLTLGCLLSERLGIYLQRVGISTRLTFGVEGESRLSDWMHTNAFVTWQTHPRPWEFEAQLIGNLSLPLNLAMNKRHPFHETLSQVRREAKAAARLQAL